MGEGNWFARSPLTRPSSQGEGATCAASLENWFFNLADDGDQVADRAARFAERRERLADCWINLCSTRLCSRTSGIIRGRPRTVSIRDGFNCGLRTAKCGPCEHLGEAVDFIAEEQTKLRRARWRMPQAWFQLRNGKCEVRMGRFGFRPAGQKSRMACSFHTMSLMVLRKRVRAMAKNAAPIAIRARNCGQTTLRQAPRNRIALPSATK